MTILNNYYASGGPDVRLFTLELTCPAWTAPILICNGFKDQTCVTEDARTLTFIAAAMLPGEADADGVADDFDAFGECH